MNRLTLVLCVAVAFISAVVTSFVYRPDVSVYPAEADAPVPESPSDATANELLKLQETISSQARQIQALQEEVAELMKPPAEEIIVDPVEVPAEDPRETFMSRLEEEDPERHQRILERLKETNEETVQAIADAADFLFNLDMSLMTPEQQQNHQKLLELMEDSWAQVDLMQENPQSPEAEAAQAQLHKNVMAMKKAFQMERQIALEQWLQRQGFSGEQALAMRTEIEEVYTKTEPTSLLPGTQFISENMMISVQQMDDGEMSQTISLNIDGALNAE